jgi:hypothetical protein
MGKIFFLVWAVYNPDHTVTVSYMGGHEYASAQTCQTMTETFNNAVDITQQDFACTTIAPEDAGGTVFTIDQEALADWDEFLVKTL